MTPARTPSSGRGAASDRGVLLAVLLALAAATGCAAHGGGSGGDASFHRLWEDGRYRQAVALFERDSTLHRDERVLWRVALARLQPVRGEERPGDPAGAARALERLVEAEPDGERAVEARTLLELIRTLEAVRTQLERLKEIDLGEPPDGGG